MPRTRSVTKEMEKSIQTPDKTQKEKNENNTQSNFNIELQEKIR